MKTLLAILASLGFAAPTLADRMPAASSYLPAYKTECGSCHVAFPPSLLSSRDWRKVMAGLDKHYGDNASLDDKTRLAIEAYLARNGRSGTSLSDKGGGKLPRITTSAWFVRKHHEVPRSDWNNAKVKSPANCGACHTKASAGGYREREIVMPDGGRWEDG